MYILRTVRLNRPRINAAVALEVFNCRHSSYPVIDAVIGDGGKDFYDISLVDGFNIPISITPQGGSGCKSTSCAANVNAVCDPKLAVRGADGTVIACKSACVAFNQPQYCCTGAYSKPETCPPTQYSMTFKQKCPQAYSYAYDDKSSTFTCPSGGNYLITFCP
ncbi:hypothetical protein DKX38_024423 [Salix brachista]|uniref:Thaumatin-like protein n=1 Tax=Salix brachista TaxID=2182728 RepID=A0A5N5JQ71_9ROSI|nr:hypothetical protein DKX38_024423 [Salix brachista]